MLSIGINISISISISIGIRIIVLEYFVFFVGIIRIRNYDYHWHSSSPGAFDCGSHGANAKEKPGLLKRILWGGKAEDPQNTHMGSSLDQGP